MADLFHYYGGDLSASPSGDLLLADQTTTGEQRVYRRLLTNPALADASGNVIASGDYLAEQDYGAGVQRYIGSPDDVPSVRATIRGQMLMEDAVSQNPAPVITLNPGLNGLSALIQYTDADTATPQFVEFDIDNT